MAGDKLSLEQRTVIQLLRHAMNGNKIDQEQLSNVDLDKTFEWCQCHKVSALACNGFSQPEQKWINAKLNSTKRMILFDSERKKICHFFDVERIWYCPLKGIILKNLYPEYGTREMADNDILFDEKKAKVLYDYMLSKGYKAKISKRAKDDVYTKEPIYNFEMHRSLFYPTKRSLPFYNYYADVKRKLIKSNEGEYEYQFSEEDFYIYMIAHAHKHLSSFGSGIRTLVDLYLYIQKNKEMDWAYIETELKKLKIDKEEKQLRTLADKLFSREEQVLTEEEEELIAYIMNSGAYGVRKNLILKNLSSYNNKNNYKIRYFFGRVFPTEEILEDYFPFFFKHKWARPFLIFYRLNKAVFVNLNGTLNEIRIVLNEKNGSDE